MKRERFLNWAKKYHKWPALIISVFLIFISLSGIVMNHRYFFSKYDINRKYLPGIYKLGDWNLGSVKSFVKLSDGTRLIYGNSGVWKTDSVFSEFTDFNTGFPDGMDNRKIRVVKETLEGNLLAGTYFGMYRYSKSLKTWEKVNLPVKNERIQDIVFISNKILVMTRSELVSFSDSPDLSDALVIQLKPPADYNKKVSLFRFFWITHSGEIAGLAGRLFLDFLALLIILLVITGLIYFIIPKISGRLKERSLRLLDFRRKNLRWHNKAGAWFFIFLIVVPLTGMFLRPPFLIMIANSGIPLPPVKSLGFDNPWEDKLRAIAWSGDLNRFIISTSEGFYYSDGLFASAPERVGNEPPVSVMGINVFEYDGNGSWIVGSFEGLYLWNPEYGNISNMAGSATGSPGRRSARGSAVQYLISGMISQEDRVVVFDYDRGAVAVSGSEFPEMPENIILNSPMPLWNVAQEIHTGRIYQPIFGPFYILLVPLTGLLSILVFFTGYIRWRKIFRKAN